MIRDLIGIETFLDQLIVVGVPVALGTASYLGTAMLLKVEEMQLIKSILRRRSEPANP
jgi:hypothetical protein